MKVNAPTKEGCFNELLKCEECRAHISWDANKKLYSLTAPRTTLLSPFLSIVHILKNTPQVVAIPVTSAEGGACGAVGTSDWYYQDEWCIFQYVLLEAVRIAITFWQHWNGPKSTQIGKKKERKKKRLIYSNGTCKNITNIVSINISKILKNAYWKISHPGGRIG